jgi:hypothetical protein
MQRRFRGLTNKDNVWSPSSNRNKSDQNGGADMPRGANAKREREYEELKERFHDEGRYKGREEEVASRIVNKQRSLYGETKEDKKQEREGTDADRNLPIDNYRTLTIPQIASKSKRLSQRQLGKLERFEKQHKNRKGAIEALEKNKRSA